MAYIEENLWMFNLAKVVVVDVTDDYRLMQPPMPSEFYPVISELWLPRHNLATHIAKSDLVQGYLYDWHESPPNDSGDWYVGVVQQGLTEEPAFRAMFTATS